MTAAEIGVKVGKIINRHKMGKHFDLTIKKDYFSFTRNEESINRETQIDGIYIVRTSEEASTLSAANTVRTYKSLGQVEQAFRCIKGVDLRVRPIHHRNEIQVRSHLFLCMLAYYVEWHMRKMLAPILFQDEELDVARWERDPVAKAKTSKSARVKKGSKKTTDGWPVHSLRTLLDELGTLCKNRCKSGEGKTEIRFEQKTKATPFQQHVFNLIGIKE